MPAASSPASLSIGVTGRTQAQSMFEVAPGRNVHVDLPAGYSAEHLALAAKDAEILMGILKDKPQEVQAIISAVSAGNFTEARKVAKGIGITEEDFMEQGGGLWGVVIVIAVVAVLLLEHD